MRLRNRLNDLMKSALLKSLTERVQTAFNGEPGDLGASLQRALSVDQESPAQVMAKTDVGLSLVLDPAFLLGKAAVDLRAAGFLVPDRIPNCAVVRRNARDLLVFAWNPTAGEVGP